MFELSAEWALRDRWAVSTDWDLKETLITFEVGIVAAVATSYGWRVLMKRSEFLIAPIKKADDEEEEPMGVRKRS